MTKVAESLAQLAARMLHELSGTDTENLVPPVMEGISKMQELMSDLLAYSGQIRRSAASEAQTV
jgi:hypothetical protein